MPTSMRRNQKYLLLILIIAPLPLFMFITGRNYGCCSIGNSPTQKRALGSSAEDENTLNLFVPEEAISASSPLLNEESQSLTHTETEASVAKMCAKHKKLPTSLSRLSHEHKSILMRHLMVNDDYKFIYCYTPKVACSNWKKVLKQLYGTIREEDFKHMDHSHGFKYLSEYSDEEIEHKLKTYFKFMFVRNPTERALSVYRNKFNEIESFYKVYGAKIMTLYHKESPSYKGKVPGDDVSFSDFLRYIATGVRSESMNEHYMPMTLLCQPCLMKFDFIGMYDNLAKDSKAVLQAIQAPEDVHFPERQTWYKPTTDSYLHYYFSLISPQLLQDFINKYTLDYAMFSFPQPYFTESNSTFQNLTFHLR